MASATCGEEDQRRRGLWERITLPGHPKMSSRRRPDKRLRVSLSIPASPGLPSCRGRDNRRSTSYNQAASSITGDRIGAGGSCTLATTHASKPRREPKTILAPPAAPLADVTTIADLLKRLGNIPAGRRERESARARKDRRRTVREARRERGRQARGGKTGIGRGVSAIGLS